MPATSSVVGSRAELATLPWLLLVLLRANAGAFKLGVVREEPFAKFSTLCPGSFEMQNVKLCLYMLIHPANTGRQQTGVRDGSRGEGE